RRASGSVSCAGAFAALTPGEPRIDAASGSAVAPAPIRTAARRVSFMRSSQLKWRVLTLELPNETRLSREAKLGRILNGDLAGFPYAGALSIGGFFMRA